MVKTDKKDWKESWDHLVLKALMGLLGKLDLPVSLAEMVLIFLVKKENQEPKDLGEVPVILVYQDLQVLFFSHWKISNKKNVQRIFFNQLSSRIDSWFEYDTLTHAVKIETVLIVIFIFDRRWKRWTSWSNFSAWSKRWTRNWRYSWVSRRSWSERWQR